MKKIVLGVALILATGFSIVAAKANKTADNPNNATSERSEDDGYLPNTYFTGSGTMANIYVKMLAENILHKHGIQAEVTIS